MAAFKKTARFTAQLFGLVTGENFTTPSWLAFELHPVLGSIPY